MKTQIRTLVFGLGMAALGAAGATTVSAVAGPGFERPAHGPHARGPKMPGARFAHAVSKLDVTDEQQAMLDDLRESTRADMMALHQAHRADMDGLKEQFLGDGDVDRDALHAMLDEHGADRLAMAHTFLDKVVDLQATLTPDQKAELRDLAGEMEARREQRREAIESGEAPRRRGRR